MKRLFQFNMFLAIFVAIDFIFTYIYDAVAFNYHLPNNFAIFTAVLYAIVLILSLIKNPWVFLIEAGVGVSDLFGNFKYYIAGMFQHSSNHLNDIGFGIHLVIDLLYVILPFIYVIIQYRKANCGHR